MLNIEKLPDASAAPIVRHTWEPLRLTHAKPVLTEQDAMLIARPDLWHKFIIFDIGNYDKTMILDATIQACEPEILLPVTYTLEDSQKATFIAKCNIPAVKNLVKHGLRIQMLDGHTLALDIVLGFVDTNELHVNPQRAINQALKSRYKAPKKLLNLDDFKNDKALRHVYCPISSPRVFNFVIRCCNVRITGTTRDNSKLSIRELSLRSNGITGVAPFDKHFNYHLTKLDLRNNAIHDVRNLRDFTNFRITELWLDGNPLCSYYATTEDYIRGVKTIFPHVQRLDGVVIGVEKFIPVMQMNYLADLSRTSFIKQFIKHFFTFYDQDDRNVMGGLYDPDALFSITLGAITNTTHLQMTKAFASNRNLLKFVDYAKCHEFLLRGPDKIIAALRRQPATIHNYEKFNIDVLHFSEDSITIAVQGIFCYREYPNSPLFFNRTFVIIEIEDNEYCIANDQYHIQSGTSCTKNNIVDKHKVGSFIMPRIKPTIFSSTEKQQMLMFMGERTTMNEKFCRHYLENANWNIRVALGAFMKAYTVNDVAPEAFVKFI